MSRTLRQVADAMSSAMADIDEGVNNGELLADCLGMEDMEEVRAFVEMVVGVALRTNSEKVGEAVADAFLLGLIVQRKLTRLEGLPS